MLNHTTLPLAPNTPSQTSSSSNYQPTDRDQRKYCLTKTIYAVGIAPTTNSKEKITQVHGANSDVVTAAAELESYLADPEFRQSCWFRRFFGRLRRMLEMFNPFVNEYGKTKMADEFIDELINDGYIRCLRAMAVPSGKAYVAFAQSYAATHNMPFAAALLFNRTGGARMALRYFLTAEKSHGQHRPVIPVSKKSQKQWFDAGKTINWPTVVNEKGKEEPLDVIESRGKLPEGVKDAFSELWRRNPSLRGYTGTKRLSGNIPFQIVEDAVDIIFHGSSVPAAIKMRYDQIVETANKQGIDSFYAVYQRLFSRKKELRPYWDKARKMLCEYSLTLWEKQSEQQIIEGKYSAADGVTCKQAKISTRKPLKTSLPGTIYLNNGRYFWVVKDKMKPVGLVDERNKRVLPGTIGNCQGRYFWVVPGVLKRQRLVAKGEKFCTTDKAVAEKIALSLWQRIQEKQPKLATRIKARRPWGTATKDKTVALKVARGMWKDIQQNDPELATKILTDNRPVPQEHWIAQIGIGGMPHHIGSFKTRLEATEAYTKEFEKVFGYPPGYNVRYMPRLDKVWPTWKEEESRLEAMNPKPVMPVIGLTDEAKSLFPVIRRMQKVDWLVKNCMVVFDNSVPFGDQNIAIESRGQQWYGEIKQQGKNPVIYGSTSIDRDNRRIRITIFNPAIDNASTLAEEVYHLVYRIIGTTNATLSGSIQKWYGNRIRVGADPTLSEDEAFAMTMAQEDCKRTCTSLPCSVVRQAKKIFSEACRIPNSVVEAIMATA